MKKNKHTGGSFDDFLKENNIYEEVTASALKKVFMAELEKILTKRGMKSKVRKALNNSPSTLSRVMSDNPHVEYETLFRAGQSVGYAPVIHWVKITDL